MGPREPPALRGALEALVSRALQGAALQDRLVLRVLKAVTDSPDHKAQMDPQVNQDHLELLDHPDNLDQVVRSDHQDRLDHLDHQDQQEGQVLLVLQDLRDQWDPLDQPGWDSLVL